MKIFQQRPRFKKEWFLFLLPLFFILHGYTEDYQLVSAGDCLALLGQYLLASAGISLLFFFIFRSWRKAAVFSFLVMCFQFFFGSTHDALKSILPGSFLVSYTFILPLTFIAFIAAIIYFARTKREFNRLTKYINILLFVLIAIDAVQLPFAAFKKQKQSAGLPAGSCDSCSKPDVYFIIADSYAGQKELKETFHFDNSVFENQLRERGFHIVDNSISNYNATPYSTASILSMNYLRGIEGINTSKGDRHLCYRLINKNPTIDFFRTQGYQFKNFSVFKFNDEQPPAYSYFILAGKDLLTSQTFLSRLERDIRYHLVTSFRIRSEINHLARAKQQQAETELGSVQALYSKTMAEISRESNQPRFVYAHLMMPHYPYYFDSAGRAIPTEELTEESNMDMHRYLSYLQYSNAKFIELIDQIFAHSKKPPVIILMGDHGFREFADRSIDRAYVFMNLNAVFLPGKDYSGFYKGMSNVNQFRVILNKQFGQKLPLLDDKTIFIR